MAAEGSKPRGTTAALSKHTTFLFSHPRNDERVQMNRWGRKSGATSVAPPWAEPFLRPLYLFLPLLQRTYSIVPGKRAAPMRQKGERKKKRGGAEAAVFPREERKDLKHAEDTWQTEAGRFDLHTAELRCSTEGEEKTLRSEIPGREKTCSQQTRESGKYH